MMLKDKAIFLGSYLSVILCFCTSEAHAIAVKECEREAKRPLEIAYCELVKLGAGHALPDFYNFRRNPESTQRLFLKSAANRSGITLPKIEEHQGSVSPLTIPAPVIEQNVTQKNTPAKTSESKNLTPNQYSNNSQENRLRRCSLIQDQISCAAERYFLAINVPVDYLNKNALTDRNHLAFREKSDQESILQYLSHLYPVYIEKMLHIGLGDSTVSFTKFNAIYEESIKQGENFVKRFQKMYDLLKNERQTNAVKQRYQENYPNNIENCMRLNAHLIVCDNVEQNWVYKKVNNY